MRHVSDPAVLYVEDDPNDIRLMRYAWARVGVPNPLHILREGEEAIRYLSGQGRYVDRGAHPMPCLMLIDLKLPGMSGLDVLKWLRTQPVLQTLRVIVLSSSRRPPDIATHPLVIDEYLAKPAFFDEWVAMVTSLRDTWLGRT
jgi:CheY-like chemotaxis protein